MKLRIAAVCGLAFLVASDSVHAADNVSQSEKRAIEDAVNRFTSKQSIDPGRKSGVQVMSITDPETNNNVFVTLAPEEQEITKENGDYQARAKYFRGNDRYTVLFDLEQQGNNFQVSEYEVISKNGRELSGTTAMGRGAMTDDARSRAMINNGTQEQELRQEQERRSSDEAGTRSQQSSTREEQTISGADAAQGRVRVGSDAVAGAETDGTARARMSDTDPSRGTFSEEGYDDAFDAQGTYSPEARAQQQERLGARSQQDVGTSGVVDGRPAQSQQPLTNQ